MKFNVLKLLILSVGVLISAAGQAAPNEVYSQNGLYYWKINDVVQGSTTNLADAINSCVWNSTGAGREIHILTGGDLSATIGVPPDVSIYGHDYVFNVIHDGYTVWARGVDNIGFHDMTIVNAAHMVFRITACDNVSLSGIHIDGGFIGMRIDSRDSSPWLATSYNLTVTDCVFENLSSHGLETYGIDGCVVDNILSKNCGECGVLFNGTRNGTVGTIDSYRCCYGGGYAGLRFANGCFDMTVEECIAIECGRGLFTVSDCGNIVIDDVYIRDCSWHSILLQNSDGVVINGGSYNGDALNHYTSVNCVINAAQVVEHGITGTKMLLNRASGRSMDVWNWNNVNGGNIALYDAWGGTSQQFIVTDEGDGLYSIRSVLSGNRSLDVYGYHTGNNGNIVLWDYLGGVNQLFYLDYVSGGCYRLTPSHDPYVCVDAYGAENGDNVGTWTYWGGVNQQWAFMTP